MIKGNETVVRIVKGSTDLTSPIMLHSKKPKVAHIEKDNPEELSSGIIKGALMGFIVGMVFFGIGHLAGLFSTSVELSLLMGIPTLLGACTGYITY